MEGKSRRKDRASEDIHQLMAEFKARREEREALASELAEAGRPVQMVSSDGERSVLVGPDMSHPGNYRITYFDSARTPTGHSEYWDFRSALGDALTYGYKPKQAPEKETAPSL